MKTTVKPKVREEHYTLDEVATSGLAEMVDIAVMVSLREQVSLSTIATHPLP